MKKTILIAIAILVAFAGFARGETPDIKNSAVTIPWEDFKKILEKYQTQTPPDEPAPPVEFALGRGTLSGELKEGVLSLTAEYPITIFKKGWVRVPLVGTAAPIADILLDGKLAPVTGAGSEVALILRGPGSHKLSLSFKQTASMRPGPGSLSLPLPAGAGQVLTLKTGPKFSNITVDNATVSAGPDGTVVAILQYDTLNLGFTVAAEKTVETAKEQEKLPSKVLVENSTLVSIDEGFIRAIVQLAYEVRHSPVSRFMVKVPEGYEVADCSGASLIGWNVDPQTRLLTADVGYDVKGDYDMTLVLERSTKEESFIFDLPAVEAVEVERERGFFAVQVTGGVEVSTGGVVKGLQMVDAKELPSGLRGGATNPVVLSYKYLAHPFQASLKVVRHKTEAVLGATVDSANYVMQITRDGDCVTRALYSVRNNRKQFLEVELPGGEKTKLWSSFVAGKPVRPSKTKEGKILLPLEKSSQVDSTLESFDVEIIYYSSLGRKLGWIGKVDVKLPMVDLPISESDLTVFAPGDLAYRYLGGSMDPPAKFRHTAKDTSAMSPGFGGDTDDMLYEPSVRDGEESPEKEKKSRGILGLAKNAYEASGGAVSQRQGLAEQVFQERVRAAQSVTDGSGANPARFNVPELGAKLTFRELITLQEASTVKFGYRAGKIQKVFAILLFLLALAVSWFVVPFLPNYAQHKKTMAIFAALVLVGYGLILLGANRNYATTGAVLGFAARFVIWLVGELRRQERLHKEAAAKSQSK